MESCPVCHSPNLRKYSYSNHLEKLNRTYIKHLVANALSPLLRLLNKKYHERVKMNLLFSPFFHLLRCDACGHGVYERHIEPELLRKYYNAVYWQAKGLPSEKWHDEQLFLENDRANGQFACIEKWLVRFKELDILEIGAGDAFFSRHLREKYLGTVRLHVVEAGSGWKPYYLENSIDQIADFFPFQASRIFHYIHTSHWLEHASSLEETIEMIKGFLVEDGLVFVEVPNCNIEYYSLDIGDAPHIHFFTKTSLRALFENYGFKTLSIDEYGLTFREEYERRSNPDNFDKSILFESNISIRKNIPRKGGNDLRALFELPTS